MSQVDVSIILPVKDPGPELQECIDAILTQSCRIELILILSGNDERTDSHIAPNKKHIDQLLHDEGKGVYAAMNQGISAANGDWLYFIGADDKLHKDALSHLLAIASEKDLILYGDVKYVERKHRAIPQIHRSSFSNSLYWKNTLHHQGTLYKKELFMTEQFDPERRILADYELNLKFKRAKVQAKGSDILVCTCAAGGLSKVFNIPLYKEELAIKKKVLPRYLYWANVPWVWGKYFIKHYFSSRSSM